MTGQDLTDRERLLAALEGLTGDYWITHPALGLPLTGTQLGEWMNEADADLAIGWHIQSDERAFGYGYPAIPWAGAPASTTPVCARCVELNDQADTLPADDEAAEDAWRAAELAHVIGDHHRLVDTLLVLVRGDRDLVVDALRRHGLDAHLGPYNHVAIDPGTDR